MKSTLLNMVLVLLAITLVASTALGFVYNVTKGPIEAAKLAKTTGSLALVMPEFDNDPFAEAETQEIDGLPIIVYTGKKGNDVSGYAVETMTKAGFSGEIKLMVGFKPDGEIYNIEVLRQNETPGLGSKMADPDNALVVSFKGRNSADLQMKVTKDGGDINAITASTISSRAYVDAVERGYRAFRSVALGVTEKPVDYLALVLPEKLKLTEPKTVMVDSIETKVVESYDISGPKGYAVEVATGLGFKGTIRLMVGFAPDGTINNVAVMEQNETPGLGAVIAEPDNAILASIKGEKSEDIIWKLNTDGSSVDAVSGSTVTSNAYLAAVKNACAAYMSYVSQNTGNE